MIAETKAAAPEDILGRPKDHTCRIVLTEVLELLRALAIVLVWLFLLAVFLGPDLPRAR